MNQLVWIVVGYWGDSWHLIAAHLSKSSADSMRAVFESIAAGAPERKNLAAWEQWAKATDLQFGTDCFRTGVDKFGVESCEFFGQKINDVTAQELIKLGWTPPGEKARVRFDVTALEEALNLARHYDKLSELASFGVAHASVPVIGMAGANGYVLISNTEIIASIDRQKKEAQDALAKLGIEYP